MKTLIVNLSKNALDLNMMYFKVVSSAVYEMLKPTMEIVHIKRFNRQLLYLHISVYYCISTFKLLYFV